MDYGSGWSYTPYFFGAVGDGIVDDTKAVKKMFRFAHDCIVKGDKYLKGR